MQKKKEYLQQDGRFCALIIAKWWRISNLRSVKQLTERCDDKRAVGKCKLIKIILCLFQYKDLGISANPRHDILMSYNHLQCYVMDLFSHQPSEYVITVMHLTVNSVCSAKSLLYVHIISQFEAIRDSPLCLRFGFTADTPALL